VSDYSRFPLPTDTAHIRIESRQYRIFRFDLGEGVARWKVAVGAAIVVPWFLLLGLIVQVPPLAGHGKGSLLYVFPAVIMTWAALRPDAGGRPRYALWLDRFRYWMRRTQPMIANPISRPTPGRPFIVSASWVVLNPARSRRIRKHLDRDARSAA
jgi:hypothetical protein